MGAAFTALRGKKEPKDWASRTFVVYGATGAQGGGCVRGLSARGGCTIKAVTRSVDSDKAKALIKLPNVTVVKGDLDDAASVDSLLEGAYGVFLVTNFWEHKSAAKETAQCETVAKAAKKAGVKHIVWSTLEDTRKEGTSEGIADIENEGGKYKVPHFDGKGEADAIFAKEGVPTTCMRTSFYWENFVGFGMGPKKGEDGSYTLTLPLSETDLLPCIAAKDIGLCAAGIFANSSLIGKTVGIVGETLTCPQMAAKMSKHLKLEVKFKSIPHADYVSADLPGGADIANMFQWQAKNTELFCSHRDRGLSKKLNPKLEDFEKWLTANAAKIPL